MPDPEEHSGQLRLQLFVSSTPIETGIPETDAMPVTELFRYENPESNRLAGLIKVPAIQ